MLRNPARIYPKRPKSPSLATIKDLEARNVIQAGTAYIRAAPFAVMSRHGDQY